MKFSGLLFTFFLSVGFCLGSGSQVLADEAEAFEKYSQAQLVFAKRGTPGKAESAIELLLVAEREASDVSLRYDIFILQARTYYWIGLTSKAPKSFVAFEKGWDAGKKAIVIRPEFADAYYWTAINVQNFRKSLPFTKRYELETQARFEAVKLLREACERKDQEGHPGEALDDYGPMRALSINLRLLPSPLGGGRAPSRAYAEKAFEKAPSSAMNRLVMAEQYYRDGRRVQAVQLLEELVSQPDWVSQSPESEHMLVGTFVPVLSLRDRRNLLKASP